jgi:hypothetical protein
VSALAQAALALAAGGWQVFPLRPRSKVPMTRRGFHDASCDRVQVARWWDGMPAANLGVACGASGLLVVDLDGDEAAGLWANLVARNGGHEPTLHATTGTFGGRHVYFAAPPGGLPNTAGKLGAGIDTRGTGGYVVAPPSVHPSGRRYRWQESPATRPAPAPQWLVPLLDAPRVATALGETRPLPPGAWATPYGERALEGLCDEMLAAPEGQRNELLVRLAYRAGRLGVAGELDEGVAEAALVEAGVAAGLSRGEAARTFRSGFDAGEQAGPAVVPERRRQ